MAYDKNNVFAKIIRGEIPCGKIYEDEHVLAFNDLHPKAYVHILVLPKGEYTDMSDFSANASATEIEALFRAVGKITKAQGLAEGGYRMVSNCGHDGGQEVPHLHLHIMGGEKLKSMQ